MLLLRNHEDVVVLLARLAEGVAAGFMMDVAVLHRLARCVKAASINYALILRTLATLQRDQGRYRGVRFKVQQVVLVLQAIQASGVGKCLWLHGNTEVGVVGVLEAGQNTSLDIRRPAIARGTTCAGILLR